MLIEQHFILFYISFTLITSSGVFDLKIILNILMSIDQKFFGITFQSIKLHMMGDKN